MSRFLPGSLRGQLLLLILLTLALAQALVAWLFADEREMALRTALGQEAASRAANVARLIAEAPEDLHGSVLRAADSPLVRFSLAAAPAVDDADHGTEMLAGQIAGQIGTSPLPEVRLELHQTDDQPPPMPGMPGMSGQMAQMHRAMQPVPISSVEMKISIAMANGSWLNVVTRFHRPPYQLAWTAIATFAISAILIGVTVWITLGRLTGPLRVLARSAQEFGRGAEAQSIAPSGPNELRSLTSAFNRMQERIRRFVDDRTRLLAALSHDLRSPLTALRVQAEMIEEDETRERIVAITEEMQEMVESTLAFARGVSTSDPVETVDLGELVAALVADMGTTLGNLEFQTIPGKVDVQLRQTSMRRALRNLIENAIRYGGGADIRVWRNGESVCVAVQDRGPGIAEDQLEHVFAPFVRLESSRSRDTGGTGLGLSIARTIVQSHGGDISLENREGGGLKATVTLPLA
ncbi:ATP-binding protein [Aliiruegeria lutimaris]|uniref:histidine kinase n=1 Tax=Aliiruegeria lutimaris TaxID=571298 RepID=A0A1G8YI85_9RHOB|nr:ATP-binding protein [Aliiruegeria lutimaris]SDK02144.1 His Kinase A (phospho-acceptor) domain-containing protein [Aliiruegeria lutimaris]